MYYYIILLKYNLLHMIYKLKNSKKLKSTKNESEKYKRSERVCVSKWWRRRRFHWPVLPVPTLS